MVTEYLVRNPQIELVQDFADEGVSGRSGKHLERGLGDLIECLRNDKNIKVLLVEAIDRLSRMENTEFMKLFLQLIEFVEIHTLEDNQVYSRERYNTDPSSGFILFGKCNAAWEYSDRLSRRIAATFKAKREKAQKGEKFVTRHPFWMNSDGTLNDKTSIILDLVKMYEDGHGDRHITQTLKEKYAHEMNPCMVL